MKKTHYIPIFIIAISCLSACMQKANTTTNLSPELVEAEAMMYEHPDSALQILQSMQTPAHSDKLQNATWALLLTQAKYKNYIQQPSDSLINIAYDYFMQQNDARKKATVLYYKAALCKEANKTEEAQEYYLKAIGEVEKTKDYQLAHLIYAELGDIYVFRFFYEYALQAFEKALHYAQLSKNESYIYSSYMYLARISAALSKQDNAIEYYEKTIQMSENAHDNDILTCAMNELAGIYTSMNDYQSALIYAQKALKIKESGNLGVIKEKPLETSFLVIGKIYYRMNIPDSAYYYLNKATSTTSIYTIRSAYYFLYKLSAKEKEYKKMAVYCDSLWKYQESIQKLEKNSDLTEMQEKYNQQKILNEKNRLKIEKDQTFRYALIVLTVLIIAIAILIFFYQRKLLRKERTIQKNEEELRSNTLKIQENEMTISRNQSRMEELAAQMEENKGMLEQLEELNKAKFGIQHQNEILKQENQVLQKNIDRYSSSLNEKSKELNRLEVLAEENQRLRDRETFLSNQLIKKTDLLNTLKTAPKYIDEVQWEEIKENVNHLFDNYTIRLVKQIPSLTESDLQICCLIKLHISNPDIATLLGISSNSVSKRKLRLKERIIQEIGTLGKNQTLDLWLWEF